MIEVSLNGREICGCLYFDAIFSIRDKDISVKALWDMGAVHSCIRNDLIDPTWTPDSENPVYGANDKDKSPDEVMRKKYRTDIRILGVDVLFKDALVASMPLTHEAIIGMDIISLLDSEFSSGILNVRIGANTK